MRLTTRTRALFCWVGMAAVLGIAGGCDDDEPGGSVDTGVPPIDASLDVPGNRPDAGGSIDVAVDTASPGSPDVATDGAAPAADAGLAADAPVNPNMHAVGDPTRGRDVFRFETFGTEGFWTDAAKLPAGIVAAGLTPVQALKAGLSVNVEAVKAALDDATFAKIAAELKTDLSAANAPLLNAPATTIALINANAVIGVSVIDSNADGKRDVAAGDKVGVTCAACHAITDGSVFKGNATTGSIGVQIDGPAVHTLNVGAVLALAANSRAFYPTLQLQAPDGKTIGRGTHPGLTKTSTEAEVDAYLMDPANYPIGTFDDTVDGNGNSMHNTPMFRADLAAPWGSAGEFSKLDQFSNTVYTVLLDPTNLLTPGGRAFIKKLGGANGEAMLADYESILAATGVTGYPYVKAVAHAPDLDAVTGVRVDNQKLLDMNAYLNSLRAPKGTAVDAAVATRAKTSFASLGCVACHNADQTVFVNPTVFDMKLIFPGDAPVALAAREGGLNPISNTPGSTFDDKMIVVNASQRGLPRGVAVPLLMDLARKPVFLHDSSVATLLQLLDPARGATAPHPFYVTDPSARAEMVLFLNSLDDTSK